MTKRNTFAVIGGDKRQVATAQSLNDDGYTVLTFGLENASFSGAVQKVSLNKAIADSKYIILPLPVTLDDITLNAPLSEECILINKSFVELLKDKKVFCGMKNRILQNGDAFKSLELFDYAAREDFAIKNAVPTSEGAIQIALKERTDTIHDSKCLVAGFGRIGKILSKMLSGLSADVSVSARKKDDLSWIELLGYTPVDNSKIAQSGKYDIIFNTIPFMIFNAQTLAKITKPDSLVIDLASKPGGVDFESASRLFIKSIQALSLPGKVAPKAAGEIIKNTIYKMIEEGL